MGVFHKFCVLLNIFSRLFSAVIGQPMYLVGIVLFNSRGLFQKITSIMHSQFALLYYKIIFTAISLNKPKNTFKQPGFKLLRKSFFL